MSLSQISSFIFSIFDIFLLIILMKMYINSRIYLINALLYVLHLLLFYTAVFLEHINFFVKPIPFLFSEWSGILRLHVSLAITFTLLYFVKWELVIAKIKRLRGKYGKFFNITH